MLSGRRGAGGGEGGCARLSRGVLSFLPDLKGQQAVPTPWATAVPGPAVCGYLQKALGSCVLSWGGGPGMEFLRSSHCPSAHACPPQGSGPWAVGRGLLTTGQWDMAPLLSTKAAGHLSANPGGPP